MTPEFWEALAVVVGVWLAVIVYMGCVEVRNRRAALQRIVFCDLDSAYANGYFEPGEQCHTMTALDLACDLVAYDDDLCDRYAPRLEPYVRGCNRRG